jgi:hypothetical protein
MNEPRVKACLRRRRVAWTEFKSRIAAMQAGAIKTALLVYANAEKLDFRILVRELMSDEADAMRFRVSGGGMPSAILCELQEQVDALKAKFPTATVEDRA